MRTLMWLGILLLAGMIGITAGMMVHSAYAKGHEDGGLHIRPRGPGGPPVVVPDDINKVPDHWRIITAIVPDGPNGGTATYGKDGGPIPFATEAECKAAIDKDPAFLQRRARIEQMAKQQNVQLHYFCLHYASGERVD